MNIHEEQKTVVYNHGDQPLLILIRNNRGPQKIFRWFLISAVFHNEAPPFLPIYIDSTHYFTQIRDIINKLGEFRIH